MTHMAESTRRGYSPDDKRDFSDEALPTLRRAGDELYFLLNRGYPVKGASTFVGNHHLLSERQRTALTRVVSAREDIAVRRSKQLHPEAVAGSEVHIDGFNLIITLEVAMSGSPVLRCMDGTFRDLAGLRGTYRLIGKTDAAIRATISRLQSLAVSRAVFWLDAPVSNSGRLKAASQSWRRRRACPWVLSWSPTWTRCCTISRTPSPATAPYSTAALRG